jgi:exonuclease VII small subunit
MASTLRGLAQAAGIPEAVQKFYEHEAEKIEDMEEFVSNLETQAKELEAALKKSQAAYATLRASIPSLVKKRVHAVLEAMSFEDEDEAEAPSDKEEEATEAAAIPNTAVPLGLEFYQSGCAAHASCTCKSSDGGCTSQPRRRTDDTLEILRVAVTSGPHVADHKLYEWAANSKSKTATGTGPPEVVNRRKEIMQYLHLAFTQMSGTGRTAMVNFWNRHADPKAEYVRVFRTISANAESAMRILREEIPLEPGAEGDAAERPTPRKRGKFK